MFPQIPSPDQSESPWPARVAWMLACATFPLIWVGGLVTSYDAGMAVPDWPTTFGYNMFLYPMESWIFGPWDLFVEHGHRLFGAAVGMLAILLVVVCCWTPNRPAVRWAAVGVLLLVIVQGVLGGMRVRMNSRVLAQIHGIVGPLFFAATAGMVVWLSRAGTHWSPTPSIARVRHLGFVICGVLVLQLIMGSQLRHVDGQMQGATFRGATLLHLVLAFALVVAAVAMALVTRYVDGQATLLRSLALAGLILLAVQVGLGSITWLNRYGWPAGFETYNPWPAWTVQAGGLWPSISATAHVATGALILTNYAALTTMATRPILATRQRRIVVGGVTEVAT